MITIDDVHDPRIAPYVSLRGKGESREFIIAESEKVVRALLESSLKVVSFLALPKYYERFGDVIKDIPEQYTASDELMKELVGYRLHQGVMAAAKAPKEVALEEMQGPIVALNGLCNAENVGAIERNALAFGVTNLLVDPATSPPFLRRSVRVSMGAAFSMKVHQCDSLARSLERLKEVGYTIVGADLAEPVVDLKTYSFPENYVLVIGTEGQGLDQVVVDVCDVCVRIPISSAIDSLNAAAATAIMLYQATGGV